MLKQYRKTQSADVDRLFVIRARTRENPIPVERLAQMGITPAATRLGFEREQLYGWVCLCEEVIVGFCSADLKTGEVLVLALLPEFEGQGIGRQLLEHVVADLRRNGQSSIWLAADSNSGVRAHGFYRRLGWEPSGQTLDNGDEVLVFRH